jgi:hypothetical protein
VKDCHSGIEHPSTSETILADFQEMLLNFHQYVIQLRKKQNSAFKHIRNAGEKTLSFICLEITLLMLEVQKKLKLEAACNGDAVYNCWWPQITSLYYSQSQNDVQG